MNLEVKSQKIINLLTICRRAGKLVMGFDPVKDKSFDGEVYLILTAVDLSPKTKKEVTFFSDKSSIEVIDSTLTMEDLWNSLGRKTGVIGILDEGFSKQFVKLLS